MLKAVIFDFDGIIADTEPLHYRSVAKVLGSYGIELTKDSYYSDFLGYSDHDFFQLFKDKHPVELGSVSVEQLMQQKTTVYMELIKRGKYIIKSVPKFVKLLISHNISIAICSGARRHEIEQILLKGSLLKFFNIIVSADEVEVGKPDPQGFMLALQLLSLQFPGKDIKASDCVVIEDSHWGVEAAKAAGMHTVAVTTTYSQEDLNMAQLVVDDLSDLTIEDLESLCR